MTIEKPKFEDDYDQRNMDCLAAMSFSIQQLLDDARIAGWREAECIDAIHSALETLRMAHTEARDVPDRAEPQR